MPKRSKKAEAAVVLTVPAPVPEPTGPDWVEYVKEMDVGKTYSRTCVCYACNTLRRWFNRWLEERQRTNDKTSLPTS